MKFRLAKRLKHYQDVVQDLISFEYLLAVDDPRVDWDEDEDEVVLEGELYVKKSNTTETAQKNWENIGKGNLKKLATVK